MKQGHHQIPYHPMPVSTRFGIKGWFLYDESCYSEEELHLRKTLLNIRAASNIHPDILFNENSWFHPDDNLAFITVNANAWFLPVLVKPGKSIVPGDFHIPLIENTLLEWTMLSTMMRNIGDYLLIRNQDLSMVHLNQPMNYILLDLIQILKHLAGRESGSFVETELTLLASYLRAVEVEISPMTGSDRLFLADSRRRIETQILPAIQSRLQAQFFKSRLPQIKNHLQDIAEQRHTLLHFSLSKIPVNEHPYLEYFIHPPADLRKDAAFPTIAAKACASLSAETENILPALQFKKDGLDNCPDFTPMQPLPDGVMEAYAQALTDIQEILRFQKILEDLIMMVDKTGEIFAISRFREEIMLLMQEIQDFIRLSGQNLNPIHEANSMLYHASIHRKKNLPAVNTFWNKEVLELDAFIKNQNNLARFSVSPETLLKTEQTFVHQVHAFMLDLRDRANNFQQIQMLEDTKVNAQELMQAMHAWVDNQCQHQTRICPPMPMLAIEPRTLPSTESPILTHRMFLPPATAGHTVVDDGETLFHNQSDISNHSNNDKHFYWSFLLLLPMGLLILKLIYDAWQEKLQATGDPEAFQYWARSTADKLAILNHIDDENIAFDRNYFNDAYEDLLRDGNADDRMQELYCDLTDFLNEDSKNRAINLHIR